MPAAWMYGEKARGPPRAEKPDSDPFGDGSDITEDLGGFGYRRRKGRGLLDGLRQRLDLMAVMVTVITAGVTGYVGIDLMNSTLTSGTGDVSVDTARNDPTNASGFDFAAENLTDGLENFFSQLGTVFTVIILVVVIGYLMLLRGR